MLQTHLKDDTVNRAYVKHILALQSEYMLVKQHKHPHFKFADDLFRAHRIPRQTFHKIIGRLNNTGSPLPGRRGPKNPHKMHPLIERKVLEQRAKGLSRFEIVAALTDKLKRFTPSPSSVYNILKRHSQNRLRPPQKRCKRMIIKEKSGELLHFDCYHLPRGIVRDTDKKLYLIGGIDDATRLAWVCVMPDVTALSAMFGGMTVLRMLQDNYDIKPLAIMTDNGAEFKNAGNPSKHPFERMLLELGVKHYYTKPYKPQPNGKIERFWRTLHEDMLDDAEFKSMEELQSELYGYLLYYNEHRPHSGIDGKTPVEFNKICPRIT